MLIASQAAMKSINSRKGQTSITHLMNFALPPRPQYQPHHHSYGPRQQRRNPTWGLGSGYHSIDKARYVHANYRFIVRPDREYHTQALDADVHLDWDCVLQILASAQTQLASCPICLSTPVAPRMAKCGHIFCLPCLIRYMHSTDESNPVLEKRARWKKCPICEDSVYISETRPVRWFTGQEASMLREGGDVLLKLLKRKPGSTLSLPRDAADALPLTEDIPWFNVAEVLDYARIMKGGEEYIMSQYDSEIELLKEQEKEDELMFGDDPTWTRKAIAAIIEAKEKAKGLGDPPPPAKQRLEKRAQKAPIKFEEPEGRAPDMYSLQQATKSGQSLSETSGTSSAKTDTTQTTSDLPSPNNLADTLEKTKISGERTDTFKPGAPRPPIPRPQGYPFYFYQALPNFFLSPLDIRILRAAFGDFSSFPTTILPRIEHISTGHMVDDDLRKRAKYLAHLPFGCDVSFLECDWTGSVGSSVLEQFSEEIDRRRRRNHEKEAREEKERIRAEKEEDDKRYAAARRRRPSVVERSFTENDFQPLASGSPNPDSHAFSASPPWANTRAHASYTTLASPGTSPEGPRTVWGTAAIAPSSPQVQPSVPEISTHDDGWLQGWERDLLDEDNAVAMVEASIAGEGARSTPSAGGGKKKKNKKITLMSTSSARRGA